MSQRNNSNKKSTNGNAQLSALSQLQRQIILAEARKVRGPKPKNGKQRSKRGNGQRQGSFGNPTGVSAAYSTGIQTVRPRVQSGNNMCNIKHREFIGNVSGAGTAVFTNAFTLALNPGIAATFPWLAVMAQNWETYRFKRLRFFYLTRTSTSVVGSVILCPDYDAADSAPVSEQVIDSYENVKEDAPWKNIDCELSATAMHSMGPKKFIRLGSLAANQDVKTYDVGNMFVFTVDSAAAAAWGKLWVEYDVDLFTPQLPPGGSSFTQIAGIDGSAAGATAAIPLGTAPIVTGNMQVVVGNNGTNSTISLSNAVIGAEYSLSAFLTGTVITAFLTATPTGCTLKSGSSGFPVAATTLYLFQTFTCTATAISFVLSTTATTVTDCNCILALLPTSVF